jgi:hypothetical protein
VLRLDVHRLLRSRCPSLQLLGLVVERHPRIELLGDLRQHVIGQVFEVARLLGELLSVLKLATLPPQDLRAKGKLHVCWNSRVLVRDAGIEENWLNCQKNGRTGEDAWTTIGKGNWQAMFDKKTPSEFALGVALFCSAICSAGARK